MIRGSFKPVVLDEVLWRISLSRAEMEWIAMLYKLELFSMFLIAFASFVEQPSLPT